MIKQEDTAPDFQLEDQHGHTYHLKEHLGNGYIVLFFYPKDFTYGCTKEACSFRDNYAFFKDLEAEIVGVSTDDRGVHQKFAAEYDLPYRLLSDPGRKVARLYGVKGPMGVLPGRTTFVLSPEGKVVKRFDALMKFEKHIQKAKEAIQH